MQLASAVQLHCHASDTPVANESTNLAGLPATIEHKKGTDRILHDDQGKEVYRVLMHHDYGYFNKTKGKDGDEVDVFVGPIKDPKDVYIVHMLDKGPVVKEREDEDKVMFGFPGADAAKTAFLLHYPQSFFGSMSVIPLATFKQKLATAQLPHREKKIHAGGPGSGRHAGTGVKPYDYATPDELRAKLGSNWVIAKRTPRILERYGADVKTISQRQYDEVVKQIKLERASKNKQIVAGGPGSGRHPGSYKDHPFHDTMSQHGFAHTGTETKNLPAPMFSKRVSVPTPVHQYSATSGKIGLLSYTNKGKPYARVGNSKYLDKESLGTALHSRAIDAAQACPHCGGKKIVLMPTDFETAKCKGCGKNFPAKNPPRPKMQAYNPEEFVQHPFHNMLAANGFKHVGSMGRLHSYKGAESIRATKGREGRGGAVVLATKRGIAIWYDPVAPVRTGESAASLKSYLAGNQL